MDDSWHGWVRSLDGKSTSFFKSEPRLIMGRLIRKSLGQTLHKLQENWGRLSWRDFAWFDRSTYSPDCLKKCNFQQRARVAISFRCFQKVICDGCFFQSRIRYQQECIWSRSRACLHSFECSCHKFPRKRGKISSIEKSLGKRWVYWKMVWCRSKLELRQCWRKTKNRFQSC